MALLDIQLTTNSKALDFHKGTAEVIGITGEDSYRLVSALLGFDIHADEVKIMFIDGSKILFHYDQVATIGADNTFSSSQDVVTSLENLLAL